MMHRRNFYKGLTWFASGLLLLLLAFSFSSVPGAAADKPSGKTDKDAPPPQIQPTQKISPTGSTHYGASPFSPPDHNDSTFVVDTGPGLDTGCTFKKGGPLVFTLQLDRYVGDPAKLAAAQQANAYAVLRLPAYDVDYDASGTSYKPERDLVSFNGKVVPQQYLTGQNDQWKLNSFNIPLSWIKFPTDPGENGVITPQTNTIQIDIDVQNTDEIWCTAIDWASLSIEVQRPVLLVHGIFSGPSTWDLWVKNLKDAGVPLAVMDMGWLDGIEENAAKISTTINKLRTKWGVDKVNIVAHSKGGLDSREYAEYRNTVDKLIQIGTPNAGSPLANLVQAGAIVSVGVIGTVILDNLAGKASYQLTTPYMAFYNFIHAYNYKVAYTSLAGDYTVSSYPNPADLFLFILYGGHSDTVVPVSSVFALNYANHLPYPSSGLDFSATHLGETKSQAIYDLLSPLVTAPVKNSQAQFQPEATAVQPTANDSPFASTATLVGTVHPSETVSQTLYLDGPGPASLLLVNGSGQLGFSLTSPSGIRIDQTTAANSSTIGYQKFGEGTGLSYQVYSLSNPENGNWSLQIKGITVTNPSGVEPYQLTGLISNSPITLTATSDQTVYRSGDSIILRAKMSGGIVGGAADATAKVVLPDGSFTSVILKDDGTNGDVLANDGIYTGRFTATSQVGVYQTLFTVNGHSPAVSRSQLLYIPVSASSSQFSGTFSDAGLDTDSDGFYNSLNIKVGLNVNAGAKYRMLGVLSDSSNAEIATTTITGTLPAGNQTLTLSFDGNLIYQHGVNGPYKLKLVRLAEDTASGPLPLDERTNIYTTTLAYTYNQFQHPGIFVPGTGSDRGVDTNNNTLYDLLNVSVNVNIAVADTYSWSGHLVDRNGNELGFQSGSGSLSAGVNTLGFSFDGKAIRSNDVNGPYYLNDLLIYSYNRSAVVFNAYTTSAYSASQFEGAACSRVGVISALNDTSCGTLRYSLSHAQAGDILMLKFDYPTTLSLQGIPLPPIPQGVAIQGSCARGKPILTVDGTGIAGDGLTLNGNNKLIGLGIQGFGGKQLQVKGGAGSNQLSCVVTRKN